MIRRFVSGQCVQEEAFPPEGMCYNVLIPFTRGQVPLSLMSLFACFYMWMYACMCACVHLCMYIYISTWYVSGPCVFQEAVLPKGMCYNVLIPFK